MGDTQTKSYGEDGGQREEEKRDREGAQMEKETLPRERGRKRQDRGREVEKGRKK